MKRKTESQHQAADPSSPVGVNNPDARQEELHRELRDELAAMRTVLDDLVQRFALREGARLSEIEQYLSVDKLTSDAAEVDTEVLEQALGLIRESKLDGRKGRLRHLQRFNALSKKMLAMFDAQS